MPSLVVEDVAVDFPFQPYDVQVRDLDLIWDQTSLTSTRMQTRYMECCKLQAFRQTTKAAAEDAVRAQLPLLLPLRAPRSVAAKLQVPRILCTSRTRSQLQQAVKETDEIDYAGPYFSTRWLADSSDNRVFMPCNYTADFPNPEFGRSAHPQRGVQIGEPLTRRRLLRPHRRSALPSKVFRPFAPPTPASPPSSLPSPPSSAPPPNPDPPPRELGVPVEVQLENPHVVPQEHA